MGRLDKLGIFIIILVIILVFFLGYVFYICYKHLNLTKSINQSSHKNLNQRSHINKEIYSNTGHDTAVILKTHIWNDSLEKFATKLKNETLPYNIDFYILMHSNDHSLPNKIQNIDLKKYVYTFTENEIKSMYNVGFYSMWLSNHWILMWFYNQYKSKYNYFWTIEYDVRISGNSSELWKYSGTEDFIYPIEPFKDPNWSWKNHYVGGKLNDNTKYYGYLQLARYSNRFLDYLHSHYENGENGQDEMITFSLFKRSGYTGSKNLLNNLIRNSWSVDSKESDKHKKLLEDSDSKYIIDSKHLTIFHPIK